MYFSQKQGYSSRRDYRSEKVLSNKLEHKENMTDILHPFEEPAPTRRKRSSEGKKAAGTNPYTSVPLPPCKVCGGVATGYHFGVITCEACKAFFRRALIHKHNYKCIKDDNCEITDKKLGNCSACRLRKCFNLGMSKGGVRRGRYSIAIRTQAILEAKAREAEVQDMDTVPLKRRRESADADYLLETSKLEPVSMDVFDGLLDFKDFTEFTITVEDEKPVESPTFVENQELEILIDAILSCQDAVYPTLKKQYVRAKEEIERQHYKTFEEYNLKQEVFSDLFGSETSAVSTEEFQQIFAETGLDLDDRLTMFNTKGKNMEETIAQYVNFAKLVPGFKTLNPKDVSKLLKASHMDFYLFGNYMLFNSELQVCISWDGTHRSKKSDMMKFFDEEIIDAMLHHSDKIKALNLTLEEIALVRLIALTYTDRCTLLDVQRIQNLQEKYLDCLEYYLAKTVANPGKRLSQIVNILISLRDVSQINIAANKKFLSEWDFVMHDYPLWKEMLSYDGY